MNRYFENIRERTKYMTGRQRAEYVLTYYWYHILGIIACLALLVFLIVHFAFKEEKPEFTCVMVNQAIDYERDDKMEKAFSKAGGIDAKLLEMDSDYNISYGDTILEGANESSYEKFFFRWSNGELDAVVMPKSFLEYCISLGGEFADLGDFDTGTLTACRMNGKAVGIEVEDTRLAGYLKEDREELILVFPKEGKHRENCQKFLIFMEGNNYGENEN